MRGSHCALIVAGCAALSAAFNYAAEEQITFLGQWSQAVVYASRPVYPHHARAHGLGGKGVFVVHIEADTGSVSSVSVEKSTGVSMLDRCAVDAFRRWKFKKPIPGSKVRIPIAFTPTGWNAAHGIKSKASR
jgi:TonB family protein